MSSNTYIISGQEQIAIVDPGGVEEQIGHIEMVVADLQDEMRRPVTVYLTHVHMDHWAQLVTKTHGILDDAALAVQDSGAQAIENQDSAFTLSNLLGRPLAKIPVQVRLLSPSEVAQGGEFQTNLDGWTCNYAVRSVEIAPGLMLHSQTIPLGKDDHLEIFHTPGHSPDSICIKAGSLLMVGDLFFAPNPGIAGACGWNHGDLVESIQKVIWMLENRKIDMCCSGHGRPIDAWTARKTLEAMLNDSAALRNLESITPEWAKRTAAYATDLMTEMERISNIIAWRLAYIAHVLGELEEESEAELTESLMDPRQLDALFNDFRFCSQALREGRKLDIELVHKAGQSVGRLEKLFEMKRLATAMDRSILERAVRLINDYSMTYRGFRPPYYVSYEDINGVVLEAVGRLRQNPYDDDAIIMAESDEEYIAALKTRIAHIDLLENVRLEVVTDPKTPFARMDKERFTDALLDIFERFIGSGAKEIEVTTSLDGDWVLVAIKGHCTSDPISRSQRFFERSLALSGGLLQVSESDDGYLVEIELSALG
ncbi:MAG TPA: MBL fold metallo-hydrolase [Methanotrichaceae archaeon]|nr:MBL fold metallo-hydrolase [Methanotrichaceae archaeon]HQF17666.1 MBL fold metallo-hydrolase [Methanotrichaceae archaeon]HQI92254.1 MBL fold metallo-hydrolase [Methanotrichaceae archaeon]